MKFWRALKQKLFGGFSHDEFFDQSLTLDVALDEETEGKVIDSTLEVSKKDVKLHSDVFVASIIFKEKLLINNYEKHYFPINKVIFLYLLITTFAAMLQTHSLGVHRRIYRKYLQ